MERFATLRTYAQELGYFGISLEFCEEMMRRMAPETPAIEYPPVEVVREFRVFIDGMHKLLIG